MEQLSSRWMDFHEIWYLNIFRKFVEEVQISLKSDENNVYFTWRPLYIYKLSPWILLKMINVSDKSYREDQNTSYFQLRFSESRAVYEVMWKNMVEPDRPQMTI
jgi:hypothetical protein